MALPKHLEMTHILFKIVLHLPKSTSSCLLFQFKFFEIVPMYEKKSRQSKLYRLLGIISGSSDMVWTILYQPTTHYRVFVLKKNMLAKRLWALNVCVDHFHRFCYSEIQRNSKTHPLFLVSLHTKLILSLWKEKKYLYITESSLITLWYYCICQREKLFCLEHLIPIENIVLTTPKRSKAGDQNFSAPLLRVKFR